MAQHPPPPPLPWVVHANVADGCYVPLVTASNYHSFEFQPQCFNPKQYKRVLKRRMARAKIEEMRNRRQAAAACKGGVTNVSIPASDNETTSAAADSGSNGLSNNETPCVPPAVLALSIDSTTTTAAITTTTTAAASRRAYKYISRHRHAKKRPRGPDGRYLKKEQLADYYKLHPDEDPTSVSETISI